VSPTGSSSRLFHHSSHGIHSSHHLHPSHAHSTPLPTTATTSSRYVKPGIVPKTIGWCSDYSHPVTLDKVPTPTPSAVDNSHSFHDVEYSSATATVPAKITAAPSRVTGADGVVRVTLTTTVSVPAAADDETCLFA
jgi:hypothetical protein